MQTGSYRDFSPTQPNRGISPLGQPSKSSVKGVDQKVSHAFKERIMMRKPPPKPGGTRTTTTRSVHRELFCPSNYPRSPKSGFLKACKDSVVRRSREDNETCIGETRIPDDLNGNKNFQDLKGLRKEYDQLKGELKGKTSEDIANDNKLAGKTEKLWAKYVHAVGELVMDLAEIYQRENMDAEYDEGRESIAPHVRTVMSNEFVDEFRELQLSIRQEGS